MKIKLFEDFDEDQFYQLKDIWFQLEDEFGIDVHYVEVDGGIEIGFGAKPQEDLNLKVVSLIEFTESILEFRLFRIDLLGIDHKNFRDTLEIFQEGDHWIGKNKYRYPTSIMKYKKLINALNLFRNHLRMANRFKIRFKYYED